MVKFPLVRSVSAMHAARWAKCSDCSARKISCEIFFSLLHNLKYQFSALAVYVLCNQWLLHVCVPEKNSSDEDVFVRILSDFSSLVYAFLHPSLSLSLPLFCLAVFVSLLFCIYIYFLFFFLPRLTKGSHQSMRCVSITRCRHISRRVGYCSLYTIWFCSLW